MDAPPVGMRVGTSILVLQQLHKMLLVPQKPVFPGPGHDARFARLRQDGATNNEHEDKHVKLYGRLHRQGIFDLTYSGALGDPTQTLSKQEQLSN